MRQPTRRSWITAAALSLAVLWTAPAPAQAFMPVTTDWDRPARLGAQVVTEVKQEVAQAVAYGAQVGNAVQVTVSNVVKATDPQGPVQQTFQNGVVNQAQKTVAFETQRGKSAVGQIVKQAPIAVMHYTEAIAASAKVQYKDAKFNFDQRLAGEKYRMKGALNYLVNSVDGMLMRNGF